MKQLATLGGGCYWCLEAIYQRLQGIDQVTSGYSGGHVDHPTIDQIYGGGTGHAECVQLEFDPSVFSYRDILEVFFVIHNPTTLNRQDYDHGEIYRSIIFYHSDEQKAVAQDMLAGFAKDLWPDPIVTQLKPYNIFWPASKEMQDFYNQYPYLGYCQMIIDPKIQKLRQKFASQMKPEAA